MAADDSSLFRTDSREDPERAGSSRELRRGFLEPDGELALIARASPWGVFGAGAAPQPRDLLAWALHPDERVPVAAVRRLGLRFREAPQVYRALMGRTERSLERELWNPLADAVSEAALGPLLGAAYQAPKGSRLNLADVPSFDAHRRRFEEWVARVDDPVRLRRTLEPYRAFALREALVGISPAITAEMLDDWLVEPDLWMRLHWNDALPPAARARLQELVLRALALDHPSEPLRAFTKALQVVQRTQHRPPAVAEILGAHLLSAWKYEERAPDLGGRGEWLRDVVAPELVTYPEAAPDAILAAADALPSNERMNLRLMRHPAAGPAVWERVAPRLKTDAERRTLAEVAAGVPGIRAMLQRTRDPEVLVQLLPAASPEEFERLLRRAASAPAAAVADAINRAPDESVCTLSQETLDLLLGSSDPELQDAGIRAFGRIHAPRPAERPVPENPQLALFQ